MKKTIFGILMVLILVFGCAQAQERLGDDRGDIHYVVQNGLLCIEGDRVEKIYEGDVRSVQVCGDMVYFVVSELADPQEEHPDYESLYYDTLMTMDSERNVCIIGKPLLRGKEAVRDENSCYSYTWHYGYSDMLIYKEHIYFMGDDGISGCYINRKDADDYFPAVAYESAFESGAGVYRMDLDGSNEKLLISGLGNGGSHMDIAGDRIAVASVYRNTVNVCDYVDLRLYDMNGGLIKEFKGDEETRLRWYYMDDAEFTELVSDIRTDGETIYVSMYDSEGDFHHGRMADARDMNNLLYYESHYSGSVFAKQGHVTLINDARTEFYSDVAENTSRLCWVDGKGELSVLAYVPEDFLHEDGICSIGEEPCIAVAGDMVYLISGGRVMRVSVYGGEIQKYNGIVFEPAPEYAPEKYVPYYDYMLPDSDIRLYTAKELKGYDKDTLALMRNEILARHGYVFSKEKYIEYFNNQPWYWEYEDFEYSDLNSIEMENVETIKKLEEAK